jgi:hypothetical protein
MQHRVKPFPDPDRPEDQTKWLTEEQIEKEAMKPSTKWVEAGSGSLGKVYFEILKCDKLPNMDATTLNIRDKTDAFACKSQLYSMNWCRKVRLISSLGRLLSYRYRI